jgi:hypothetical protein
MGPQNENDEKTQTTSPYTQLSVAFFNTSVSDCVFFKLTDFFLFGMEFLCIIVSKMVSGCKSDGKK